MLFASTPYTHGLPWSRWSTTNDGPSPQFLFPSSALVFVGSWTTGPAPQIHLPGLTGDRNAVNTVSPRPSVRSSPGKSGGMEISGRIVRVMTFHSSFTEIGITGWMLSTFCVPLRGPKFRLVLFWNGRLIRLPTGFCASLASSSALISAYAWTMADAATANAAALQIAPDFMCRHSWIKHTGFRASRLFSQPFPGARY